MSSAPDVGSMNICDEMRLGFRYARGASGRLKGFLEDFNLRGSGYDLQIAD